MLPRVVGLVDIVGQTQGSSEVEGGEVSRLQVTRSLASFTEFLVCLYASHKKLSSGLHAMGEEVVLVVLQTRSYRAINMPPVQRQRGAACRPRDDFCACVTPSPSHPFSYLPSL